VAQLAAGHVGAAVGCVYVGANPLSCVGAICTNDGAGVAWTPGVSVDDLFGVMKMNNTTAANNKTAAMALV
jgi:hypothetical protein